MVDVSERNKLNKWKIQKSRVLFLLCECFVGIVSHNLLRDCYSCLYVSTLAIYLYWCDHRWDYSCCTLYTFVRMCSRWMIWPIHTNKSTCCLLFLFYKIRLMNSFILLFAQFILQILLMMIITAFGITERQATIE